MDVLNSGTNAVIFPRQLLISRRALDSRIRQALLKRRVTGFNLLEFGVHEGLKIKRPRSRGRLILEEKNYAFAGFLSVFGLLTVFPGFPVFSLRPGRGVLLKTLAAFFAAALTGGAAFLTTGLRTTVLPPVEAKRFSKRSTRPAVSMSFCRPV